MPTTVTYRGEHRIIELTGERQALEDVLDDCGARNLELTVAVRRLVPKPPVASHVLLFAVTIIDRENRRRRTFRGGNGHFWVERAARALTPGKADSLAA